MTTLKSNSKVKKTIVPTKKAKVSVKKETKETVKNTVKSISHEQFLKLKESAKKQNFSISTNLDKVLTATKESSSKYALNIKTMSKSEQKTNRELIRKNFLKICDVYTLAKTANKVTEQTKETIKTMFVGYVKLFLCTDKKAITKDFINNVVYCAIGANKSDVETTKKFLCDNLEYIIK